MNGFAGRSLYTSSQDAWFPAEKSQNQRGDVFAQGHLE